MILILLALVLSEDNLLFQAWKIGLLDKLLEANGLFSEGFVNSNIISCERY